MFENPEKGDFRLKKNPLALDLGFVELSLPSNETLEQLRSHDTPVPPAFPIATSL
jgi:hypothetical protein